MKTFILSLFLFCVAATSFAQDCSSFYPFTEGVYAEFTSYSKKGKAEATTSYKVDEVKMVEGVETATIASDLKDKKGELLTTVNYDIKCENEKVSIGFNSLMNAELLEKFKDMDVEVTGTDVDLPNNLTVGQELPDADLNMTINSGIVIRVGVQLFDRKVVGRESITTPAGTFDCFVITYSSKVKMGFNVNGSAKQWLAKGVGLVKQEDYNKKGKLTGSGMLTKYSK